MVASFVKQDSNRKRFKRTLTYDNKGNEISDYSFIYSVEKKKGKGRICRSWREEQDDDDEKKTKNGKEEAVEVDGMRKTTKKKDMDAQTKGN